MTPDDTIAHRIGLIGGIGLTEVHVYAQRPAPDGLFSGCPHVHAVTDEAYYVLRGTGWVEFHDLRDGYRRVRLTPGAYLHFPPLVLHRLVSDGDLVVLGMMGNAGLAERGEARIYFGRAVDDDAARFAALVSLPKQSGLDGALERRDHAVRAYMELLAMWDADRAAYRAELARFVDVHCAAMADRAAEFAALVRQGPIAWAEATLSRLAALPRRPIVVPDVLQNAPGSEQALGMCGVLRPMQQLAKIDAPSRDLA